MWHIVLFALEAVFVYHFVGPTQLFPPWLLASWFATAFIVTLLRIALTRRSSKERCLEKAGQRILDLEDELRGEKIRRQESFKVMVDLKESQLRMQAIIFKEKLDIQELKYRDLVERLDLSGQFLILAWMWKKATISKRKKPTHDGADDVAFVWKQLRIIASRRWPTHQWTDLNLREAAIEANKKAIGLEGWKKLCSESFGFRDPAPSVLTLSLPHIDSAPAQHEVAPTN